MEKSQKSFSETGFNEVDISLIDYFLSLSPEERLKQHQRTLNMVADLKKAGKDYYARLRKSPQNSPRT